MEQTFHVTAFYKFSPLSEAEVSSLQQTLQDFGTKKEMGGLVLLATEGINGTVAGSREALAGWKTLIEERFGAMRWNDSTSETSPFKRWNVKIRTEIVALKKDDVHPAGAHNHLPPEVWHRMMEEEDVVVIDARNTYETAIGMFEGAIDPKTKTFQEFSDFARAADIPKDKKVLMYCTGGIRCEKAIFELQKNGYDQVYQLEGGILAYMQQFPHQKFKGECFIFDHRVALNQELKPSEVYGLCPHCGDPGPERITCVHCKKDGMVCGTCLADSPLKQTCSKQCRSCVMNTRKAVVE